MLVSSPKSGFYRRLSSEHGLYHRMLLTCAVIFFCCGAPVLSIMHIGVVTPSGPFAFIGERNYSLDCNITNTSVLEDYSRLFFEKGNYRISDNIKMLTTRAIRYTIPTVDLSDAAMYTCVIDTDKDGEKPIGHQTLSVDYKPKPITNQSCRVYNWQNMTCTWNLSVDYQHIKNVHVSVYWVTVLPLKSPSADRQHDCPIPTRTSCTWVGDNYSHAFTYTVQVVVEYKVKNQVLGSSAKRFNVKTLPIVEPDPVHRLEAWPKSSSCILLSWEHIGAVQYDKNFIGNYRELVELGESDWIETTLVPNITSSSTEKAFYRDTLCGNIGQKLKPHTPYQFRVAVMPAPASPENLGGYLSQWREVDAWTDEGVPSAAPEICPVCYFNVEKTKLVPNSARRVRITWKDIPKVHRHGKLTFYNISFVGLSSGRRGSVLNGMTMEGRPLTSVDLDLPSADEDFLVMVRGGTNKGESPKSSNITITALSNEPPLPKRFRVERSNSQRRPGFDLYYLHWAEMTSSSDMIGQSHSTHAQSGRQRRRVTSMPVTNLYIVWCSGDPQHSQCKGHLNWTKIDPQEVTYELRTTSSQGQGRDLLIGIASEAKQEDAGSSKVYSSGIHWSDCIYTENQKPQLPPLNVRFGPTEYASGLTVQWKKLGCDEEKSFVTEYLVRYCETLRGRKCDGEIRTVNVSGDTTTTQLSKLHQGVQYLVFVMAVSNAGLGPPSDPILYTVPSQPPEEDFTNLIVIIIIIVATTLSLVIIITFIRHCYRQKKKVPSIKGLLDLSPAQQPPCPPSRLDYQSRPLPDPPSDATYEERHIYGSNSRRVCMSNRGYDKAAVPPTAPSDDISETKDLYKVPLICDRHAHQPDQSQSTCTDLEKAALLNGSVQNPSSPVIDDIPSSPRSPSISSYIRYQGSGGGTPVGMSPWDPHTGQVGAETCEDPGVMLDYCRRETLPLRHGGRGHNVPPHSVAVFHARHGEKDASVRFPQGGIVNNFHPLDTFHNSKDPAAQHFVVSSPLVVSNIPNGFVYPTGAVVDNSQEYCTCDHGDSISDMPDGSGNSHTPPAPYMQVAPTVEPLMPENHVRHQMQRSSIPIEAALGFPPPPPGPPSPTPPYDNAPPLPTEAPSRFDSKPRHHRQTSMADPALDSDDYLEPQILSPLCHAPSPNASSPPSITAHHNDHQMGFSFPTADSTENQLSPVNGQPCRPVTTGYVPNIAVANPALNSPSDATQHNHIAGSDCGKDLLETTYYTQPSSTSSEFLQNPFEDNRSSHNSAKDIPHSSKDVSKSEMQNDKHNNNLRDSGYVPNSASSKSSYSVTNHSNPDVSASSPTSKLNLIPTHNLSSNGINILQIPSSHTRPLSTNILELPEAFLKDPLPPGSNEILTEL